MEPYIITLVILVLLSAYFSGSEIAIFSLSEVDVRLLVERNVPGAKTLQRLLEHPSRLLATILIGNNIANIGAAGLATVITEYYLKSYTVGVAIGAMTLIILIVGEITPKGISSKYAMTLAPLLAGPLRWFYYLFLPASLPMEKFLSKLTVKEGKAINKELAEEIAEQEVKIMAQMRVEEGTIDQEEFQLIENAFEFQDTTVEDIMTPKSDIIALPANSDLSDNIEFFMNVSRSRIPLYLGNPENIVGILYIDDVFRLALKQETDKILKDVMIQPLFVPEQMKAAELFRLFQKKSVHIAIVVDEYGQTVGLITMEDLLEELVGEIEDESDIAMQAITRVTPNQFLVEGTAAIEDVNEILGIHLPDNEHRTISGLILEKIQYIPKPGEKLSICGFDIIVKEASRKKIIKVLIDTHGATTK